MFEDIAWVREAFAVLSQMRSYGFSGPLPISYEAIDRFAQREGLTNDDFDEFLKLISRMDQRYIEIVTSKNKPPKDTPLESSP